MQEYSIATITNRWHLHGYQIICRYFFSWTAMLMQFGTFLLVNVFSALLPPVDPEEKDFYLILNVERNAKPEEIRKAYKKLSLRLHVRKKE